MKFENEQKYRIGNPKQIRILLRSLKAKKIFSKTEFNEIFDFEQKLRNQGCLLRLRHYGSSKGVLTYKGPVLKARHKKRRETETSVDVKAAKIILESLGLQPVAAYSKKREEYRLGKNTVTLDFLPKAGWFVEIEGSDQEIRKISSKLALTDNDREERNYLTLSL